MNTNYRSSDQDGEKQINAVLRKMEIQQENLKLEVQFQKNLAFFEEKYPNLHAKYKDYRPEQLKLLYTDEGYVNLVNYDLDNKPVYPKEPRVHSQEYVDEYCDEPTFYKISAKSQEVPGGDKDAHISNMNPLIDLINENEQITLGRTIQPHTNLLLMLGIGLGYQVEQLLEKSDIHHLIILEPHEDIFYACLHTVDWETLYVHFEKPNHSIRFFVGMPPRACYEGLRVHLNLIGLHNAIKPYIFEHLSSDEIKEAAKTFFDRIPSIVTSMGYFDDEQTSIAHTINNYRAKIPVLREHALLNKTYRNLPAFIIGNGPSLDKAVEFLKKNIGKAIIFSCGSATGSLKKMGIKPDFHVELERTWINYEWVKVNTDPEYRKGITLLALNTVPPDSFGLFDRSGMAMKSNDLGTHYISKLIGKDDYVVLLAHSNPTVVNTGVAYAAALGFENTYLFGVDLGFPQGDQHHSSASVIYDVQEEFVEELQLFTAENSNTGEIDANFGGKVKSNTLYNNSRHSIESVLHLDPNIKCFNTSEGAKIENTIPTRYEDIELAEIDGEKSDVVTEIFNQHFHLRNLKSIGSDNNIKKSFRHAEKLCDQFIKIFDESPKNIQEALALLDRHHEVTIQIGLNKETQYSYSLIKGSVNSFNLALAKCLTARGNEDECIELFNKGKFYYQRFLKQAKHRIKNELLKNDDRFFDVEGKIGVKK